MAVDDEPREPHRALMKQAVEAYLVDMRTLRALQEKYRCSNDLVKSAEKAVETSKFWVAEWAGVPVAFVSKTAVFVTKERIDIYFGAPDGEAIDKQGHMHAHYIYDGDCNRVYERKRNVGRPPKKQT